MEKFLRRLARIFCIDRRSVTSCIRRRSREHSVVLERLEPRELLTGFVVTSTGDTSDAGTLRWAIEQANNSVGADTISFDSNFNSAQTIVLNGTQLPQLTDTTGPTTISGPGADLLMISGNYLSRVFDIAADVNVSISGLAVTQGNAGGDNGGGINNRGVLNLWSVTLTGNTAVRDEFGIFNGGLGGGIYNGGVLTIANSIVRNSIANGGGGIATQGILTASHVQLVENSASFGGGGIFTTGSTTLQYCRVDQNRSETGGGGGLIQYFGDANDLDVSYSEFTNNSALEGGGIQGFGRMNIVGSTFDGNQAQNGGGIRSIKALYLANSTLANNSADEGGAVYSFSSSMTFSSVTIARNTATQSGAGVLHFSGSHSFVIMNSIVADNTINGLEDNFSGQVNVAESVNNLIGPSSWFPILNQVNGNIVLQAEDDAGLGTLDYHGGFTRTIPLLQGSPAIDAGTSNPSLYEFFQFDQRGTGFPRELGTVPDIGAFEADYTLTTVTLSEGFFNVITATSLGLTVLPLTYSLTGGADQDLFYINSENGSLTFKSQSDYLNPADDDQDNAYQVQITVTDANGETAFQELTVIVVDVINPPDLIVSSGFGTYRVGGDPVMDAGATFQADPVVTDYSAAQLTVTIEANRNSKDLLRIIAEGTGPGQISIKKKQVLFGGVVIGTFKGGAKKDPNLVIRFNSATTESAVQALVKRIGFNTKNKQANQNARFVGMQIRNLAGQDSFLRGRWINVLSGN